MDEKKKVKVKYTVADYRQTMLLFFGTFMVSLLLIVLGGTTTARLSGIELTEDDPCSLFLIRTALLSSFMIATITILLLHEALVTEKIVEGELVR